MEDKTYYVVFTNADLTEGRGRQFPLYVCENMVVARKKAHKAYIQGSDAPIHKVSTITVSDALYFPLHSLPVIGATAAEKQQQLNEDNKAAAIEKARLLGLSEEEIKVLLS